MAFGLLTLIPLAIVAVLVARAYAEVNESFVAEWAAAHGLRLTTTNRPLVWWYLRNARVLRTWGVLAGIALPPLLTVALGLAEHGVGTWFWCIFAGHLAGTVYAEVALRRPTPSGTRVATLERREVRQYLPARLRFAPVGVAGLTAALAGAGVAAGELSDGTTRSLVAIGTASAAIVAAIAVGQRWVVTRPQPFTADDLVEADDAIRSQSVHLLAGSGTAVLLALGADALSAVAMDTSPPLSTVTSLVAFAFAPAAIVSCLYYGHRAWRVRRQPARVAVPAS